MEHQARWGSAMLGSAPNAQKRRFVVNCVAAGGDAVSYRTPARWTKLGQKTSSFVVGERATRTVDLCGQFAKHLRQAPEKGVRTSRR
jgi:hypothetical protein